MFTLTANYSVIYLPRSDSAQVYGSDSSVDKVEEKVFIKDFYIRCKESFFLLQ